MPTRLDAPHHATTAGGLDPARPGRSGPRGRRRLSLTLAASLAAGLSTGLTACGDVDAPAADAGAGADAAPLTPATRPSRSSSIALSDDGQTVVQVNQRHGSVAVFTAATGIRRALIDVGSEPSSVALSPDGRTAYVTLRAGAAVVRIAGLDGAAPAVDATVGVGSEPVAIALSPTGRRAFVAELAEGRISVLDTATMTVTGSIPIDRPRALVVSNDLDGDDDDETLVAPQFFGVPVPGREGKDDGRTGLVRRYALADLAPAGAITLAPTDSGFPRGGVAGNPTVTTSPNQLGAVAISGQRVFVTSVSASPEGPPRFDNNVFPVVYVADLGTGQELTGPAGTTNLARKMVDAIPAPTPQNPRLLPGDLADLDFVPDSNIAYVVGKAGDVMVRVNWADPVSIGSTQNKFIDLAGNATIGTCQAPTGVAVDASAGRAYVNCAVSQRLAVVDLAGQVLASTTEAAPAPTAALEIAALRGQRFYVTGRGRWSNAGGNGARGGEGWSSCGSCHPDGLTDNITWVFAAGPRQTTSQDGTFSHGPGPQKQRVFNWTGIFDEHHDFERNTRDVSGGLGVITTAPTLAECGQLDRETQVSLAGIGGLARPLKELADDAAVATCGHADWDDLDSYVKTIRPPHAATTVDPQAVARGAQLFVDGGCAKCHGGAGFTVSRRYFAPSSATNLGLTTAPFNPPGFFAATLTYGNGGAARTQVSGQPAVPADDTGPAEAAPIGIAQVACGLRNVGTFGDRLDTAATDALELRPSAGSLVRAQGRAGYNVPSLYGLALGAPYLHHGQAATLADLLTDPSWEFHTAAGAANFPLVLAQPGKLDDLIAYLRSIDAATAEVAVPVDTASGLSHDACPLQFP